MKKFEFKFEFKMDGETLIFEEATVETEGGNFGEITTAAFGAASQIRNLRRSAETAEISKLICS